MSIKKDESLCPYCGSLLIEQRDRYNNRILCCSKYPKCDSYLIITRVPDMGIPANRFLRFLRDRGHLVFDIIHRTKIERRNHLYELLGEHLHKYGKYAHFRYFGIHDCIDAILFSIDFISENYYKAKTTKTLTAQQSDLFMQIANLSIDFDSNTYETSDLRTIIKLIYETKDVKPKSVNRKVGRCIFYFKNRRLENSREAFFIKKKKTIRTSVHSLTETMYDLYAKTHEFPTLSENGW